MTFPVDLWSSVCTIVTAGPKPTIVFLSTSNLLKEFPDTDIMLTYKVWHSLKIIDARISREWIPLSHLATSSLDVSQP